MPDVYEILEKSVIIKILIIISIIVFYIFIERMIEYILLKKKINDMSKRDPSVYYKIFFLENRLTLLGTIGNLSPYIGLFGTILGVMESFAKISETGNAGFSVVSGGISEALNATAAGILVAIFSVLFFNFLKGKIRDLKIFYEMLPEIQVTDDH